MITEEEVNKLTSEKKTVAILTHLDNGMKMRAMKAQRKQIEGIVKYMEEHNLVDDISNKDDKTWDRLKSFVDGLDGLIEKYETAQKKIIQLENADILTKQASKKSIVSFIKGE